MEIPDTGQLDALGSVLSLVEGAHLKVLRHMWSVLETPLADGREHGAELPHLWRGRDGGWERVENVVVYMDFWVFMDRMVKRERGKEA